MFNIFRLQLLAPLVLIGFVYTHLSWHTILLATGGSILFASISNNFGNGIISKLCLFAILGMIRGHYVENNTDFYTYKRTSFSAQVIDMKIKEHGIYVELENFKYETPNKELTYNIDHSPIFPKTAQMRIAKIEKQDDEDTKNKARKCNSKKQNFDFQKFKIIAPKLLPGAKIHAIGRFLLPTPDPIAETTHIKLPSGLIDEFYIEQSHIKSNFKSHLRSRYENNLSKQSTQLAKAILLGDTFAIDQSIRTKFQEAGIAHLLGVSVLNIAILGLIFYFIIRLLIGMLFYKLAYIIPLDIIGKIGALFVTGIYCYLVGFEYPLLRSLLMASFSIIALYFGRNRNKEVLMWSAACILFINPTAIYNIGFELSFGAVLGLCCAPNLSLAKMISLFKSSSNNRILLYIISGIKKFLNILIKSLYSTFFASSIILPISIYQFHTTSMQPFLANIIAIPFVTLIITPISFLASIFSFGTTTTSANFILVWIEHFLMQLLDKCFQIFINLASFFAPLGMNIHIDPIASFGCLFFTLSIALFACLNGIIRYVALIFGAGALILSITTRLKPPILLVHPYAIGLILEDKIIAYPKCNFITNIWEQAYARKCMPGKNISYKNDVLYFRKEKCGKIVVLGKIGLIFQELKGTCSINTKDYIIPYAQQMQKMTLIKLDKNIL